MTRPLLAIYLLFIAPQLFAQNAIGLKYYSIQESKGKSGTTAGDDYLLRLKISYTIASQEAAFLKVTADPLEDQKYVTIAETRVRKGKPTPLELDIPIPTWEKDRLNLYILLQEKDAPPGAPPAGQQKRIPRKSVHKKRKMRNL